MHKKVEIFLMVMVVIWFVLLVDATKNRGSSEPVVQPQASTTASAEIDTPATELTETTAPEEEPAPSLVEAALTRHTLTSTAVTHLVRAGDPGVALAADLAELASRKTMNPIAAFWVLVSEGLYERGDDRDGLPSCSLPEHPAHTVKPYPDHDGGAAELLTELLTLADEMGCETAKPLLGEDGVVEPGRVFWSEADDCRYAYFACSTDGAVRILCFYLRSDDAGAQINDVEFQRLHMSRNAEAEPGDAVALAAAAELLMTGTVRAGGEETPAAYTVGGFQATAERFFFTAEKEQGSLTNYRLQK